ncbi:DUF2690 domain-containing protein [Streptomyces sp. NPDC055692]|uniref:DUF2690 domain-containing protein n=1 Tax=Streptomyces sp. NPDC055692 TaxID=3155683 RepID=UPI003434426A
MTPLGDHVMKAFLDDPTCPGDACNGKNPQNQGRGEDARTFKPTVGNPAQLQIRYSEDCKAVWARIERGSPGDLVTVTVPGRGSRTAEIEYGDDKFTNMVAVAGRRLPGHGLHQAEARRQEHLRVVLHPCDSGHCLAMTAPLGVDLSRPFRLAAR